ncbi:MAG: glycosyltransferase family 1 protein [Candidatus Levybacteria bacterium]|nr:glycosyltransferase family 1 protein [Candidatus Levybacteria bacterium]
MLIGINGYEAVVSRFGYDEETGLPRRVGSGEYCYQLLVNLNKIDKKNSYIIYLPEAPTADLPEESENWHYKIIKPRKMWTLVGLSLEFLLRRSKPDVFLSPTHYLPIFAPSISLISILDTSYIHFPELFKSVDLTQLTKWTKYSAKKARSILTISQASKDDIIKTYGIPEKEVVVTYPGIKKVLSGGYKVLSMSQLEEKYGVKKDFILFVGTLQPRKNIARLIEAFSKFKTKDPRSKIQDLSLVIVGKKGWKFEEILAAPKTFGVEKKVKFLDSVTDEDLPAFYKNAVCFVLPSLYEGFGLPVLEAMQYGCPVITSNISSLPEAGGDAALYVDPLDANDIAKKLELVINDNDLRQKFIKKGYEQIKKFSWEKTAKETLSALEGIKYYGKNFK